MRRGRIRTSAVGMTGWLIGLMLVSQSCIKDIPTELPTEYVWQPLLAFPIGESDFGLKIPHGFDTTLLHIDTLSGFPQWAILDKIPLAGSIEFDFEQVLGKRDEINMVLLRVNTYNGFPIEVAIQAYLEDAGGEVIDSLFNPKMILQRGELEDGGKTAKATHTQKEVIFQGERLDQLMETARISFKGEISSIKYFPQYTFKVQMGAILGIVSEI